MARGWGGLGNRGRGSQPVGWIHTSVTRRAKSLHQPLKETTSRASISFSVTRGQSPGGDPRKEPVASNLAGERNPVMEVLGGGEGAAEQTWMEQWRRGCSFPNALPLYGPVPKIKQGCPGALETELKGGAKSQLSKETRGGGGRDPQPPPWGSVLGCWSDSLKAGPRQPAGFSDHRIAYILELKIHGGSKRACVHGRHSGAEALTPTHTRTRVCTLTRYILTYILLKYICYLQYISIST